LGCFFGAFGIGFLLRNSLAFGLATVVANVVRVCGLGAQVVTACVATAAVEAINYLAAQLAVQTLPFPATSTLEAGIIGGAVCMVDCHNPYIGLRLSYVKPLMSRSD
jgi:hypothetical protein